MANDYSSENCLAHWDFESPNWLVDDKSGLVLSPYGTGITQTTSAFMEGAAAAAFPGATGTNLRIADSLLPDGFPLKSGDTKKQIGIHFWFNTLGGNWDRYVIDKVKSGGGSFRINFGYNTISLYYIYSGGSSEKKSIGSYPSTNYWNELFIWVDGVAKYGYCYCNGAYSYFTFANEMQIDDSPFQFGDNLYGYLDGISIWNTPLTRRDYIDFGRLSFKQRDLNNYAFEPAAKACYDFEKDHFLEESINGLNLTNNGAAWDMNGCASGNGALYTKTYGGDQWAKIDEAALPADFPGKYQGTTRQFSIALWYWCLASTQPRGYVLGKYYTNYGFYIIADTASPYHLKLIWGAGSSALTFDLGVVANPNQLYFIGLRVDPDAPALYVYIHNYSTDVITEYDTTPAAAMAFANIGYGFGMLSSSGNFAGATNLDHVVFFKRLLEIDEFVKIRDGEFGAASSAPPDNLRSLTHVQAIAANVASLRSATRIEAITLPKLANLRSVTFCQPLLKAIPTTCTSKTRCQTLVLDGGDFFLTF
jgi:hypothetical protein